MILSTLCYIEKNGKYLMLNRNKKEKDINKGKWIGVGGKFEYGESPEECVLREVKEETGLILKSYKLRCIVTYVSNSWETEYMFVFTSNDFEGQQTLDCDEGDLKWIDKESIVDLNTWEGDKIFIKKIQEDDTFFTIKFIYNGEKLQSYDFKQY